MQLTQQSILDYLKTRMGIDTTGVDAQTPLFSSSLLDSFSMVDLIAFVESQSGLRLDPWDVTLDNLDSIARILAFVSERSAA